VNPNLKDESIQLAHMNPTWPHSIYIWTSLSLFSLESSGHGKSHPTNYAQLAFPSHASYIQCCMESGSLNFGIWNGNTRVEIGDLFGGMRYKSYVNYGCLIYTVCKLVHLPFVTVA
jgi:hypothetical protein